MKPGTHLTVNTEFFVDIRLQRNFVSCKQTETDRGKADHTM